MITKIKSKNIKVFPENIRKIMHIFKNKTLL